MGSSPPPPPSIYRTQVRAAGGSWQAGLDLGLSFTWDPDRIPQPMVQLAGQDVTPYAALSVTADHCLQIALDLRSVRDLVCGAAPLYLEARATLSADGLSLTGHVTELCSGPATWQWRGSYDAGAAARTKTTLTARRQP
jgi:hypothetical protein